jgi:hypothetical protein
LNALVSRIVCAVGLREAVDLACVLFVAPVPFELLLDPAALLPLLLVFPVAVVLFLGDAFFGCSVEGFGCSVTADVWIRPATALPPNAAVIATIQAVPTAPRSQLRTFITALMYFRPTHPL